MNKNLIRTAELYMIFADPIRLEIMFLLRDKDYTFTELIAKVGCPASEVVLQIKQLESINVIRKRNFKPLFTKTSDAYFLLKNNKLISVLTDLESLVEN